MLRYHQIIRHVGRHYPAKTHVASCLSTSRLQDAIHKIQQSDSSAESTHLHKSDPHKSSTSSDTTDEPKSVNSAAFESFRTHLSSFATALSQTWAELIHSSQPKDINKKLDSPSEQQQQHQTASSSSSSSDYAILVIDPSENLSTFERIQKRLSETPILQRLYQESIHLYQASPLPSARTKVSQITEDAKEAWETSQNPWIYRLSSVYDTIVSENEFTATERQLRVLDPTFNLVQWKEDVVDFTLPKFMKKFLQGQVEELQPQLGEAVYQRLSAEAKVRNQEGVTVDSNVLGIMNSEILSCHPDQKDGSSPIIVLHFMVQQINCVRKKDMDRTIVEGAEDDIRAYSYVVAFQREYDETRRELNWKIVDFMLNGAIAYL